MEGGLGGGLAVVDGGFPADFDAREEVGLGADGFDHPRGFEAVVAEDLFDGVEGGGGACPYDPICAEYRKILGHVETCRDDECSADKCRSTKKFLVTMRLLMQKDSHHKQEDYEGSSEMKDFLVGVGAVAPLSFVHVERRAGKNSDAFSAVSDATWLSGADRCRRGSGRGGGGGAADTKSSELEIM